MKKAKELQEMKAPKQAAAVATADVQKRDWKDVA
jgi:hypothetical protein